MRRLLSSIDRLRIERIIWLLDSRIYDLPRRRRIEIRREVRQNLLAASRDIGTTLALRKLGDGRRLADAYLTSEFGDRPRHSWFGAALFGSATPLIVNWVLTEASIAFDHGVRQAAPHATGTFIWTGVELLQGQATSTYVDGQATTVGGSWTPLTWTLLVVGTIVAGRLWRVLPRRAGRRTASAAS